MSLEVGYGKCTQLGLIDDLQIHPAEIYRGLDGLSSEVTERSNIIHDELESNPNRYDGHKVGTDRVLIVDDKAKIFVFPSRYSEVRASKELMVDSEQNPEEFMYSIFGNPPNGSITYEDVRNYFRRQHSQVNPLSQGVMVGINPKGRQTPLEDVKVLITKRGEVTHGSGLRHLIAGYVELPKGFENFRINTQTATNSIYKELLDECGMTVNDLITGIVPFGLAQDYWECFVQYLTLTRLDEEEVLERMKHAKDAREASKIDLVPLKELYDYAQENTFYSHSRPMIEEHMDDLKEKFDRMRRI